MKTTNHNLKAIAMGVALAIGSVSAASASDSMVSVPINPSEAGELAGLQAELGPLSLDPTFDPSERTGIALVESSLSLIAARAHIDPAFCARRIYKLSVDATGETEGTATISDFDGGQTVLSAALTEASLGALVDLTASPGSQLYGAKIKNYAGDHQWSRKNNIFLDHATWDFKHPQSGRIIPYDEHSVKDYFEQIIGVTPPPTPTNPDPGDPAEAWVFDSGFEVITKKNFPVAKWGELSWYRQQDGGDGILKVSKTLVAKNSCQITFEATGFFPFQFDGTVRVDKFIIPPPL